MGRSDPRPLVLDSGALIAFERADQWVRAAIERAAKREGRVVVPAGVLAEVWRDGTRQARLARLIRNNAVSVPALDEVTAKGAGVLCGSSGTSDVIDATVVLAARAAGAVVLSSDAADLRRIDPGLDVVPV